MASITCGNCHNTHQSVDEVKACYSQTFTDQHWDAEVQRAEAKESEQVALFKAERETAAVPVEPAREGMYRMGDKIYKVQKAVHGSGNLYAKELVQGGFVYAPGIVKRLNGSHRMTLEQAKEYGALYGTCCVCGRTLTDEVSIANGIGPVCAGKGWWSE